MFTLIGTFGVGAQPLRIAAADVDADGRVDLVTTNFSGSNASLLLGNGAGSFSAAPASPIASGASPVGVYLIDLTTDGDAELLIVNRGGGATSNVSVLLGGAGSSFAAATGSPFAVGGFPFDLAVGDLDRDGHLDLVVVNTNDDTASILRGDGAGAFTGTGTVGLGDFVNSVKLADLNGDGDLDLIATNFEADTVSVRLGAAGATFGAEITYATGSQPNDVEIGDLNGDGHLDMVAANSNASTLTVRFGDGTGAFGAASTLTVGSHPYGLVMADLDLDGILDLATANHGANTVSVLHGLGNGTFAADPNGPYAVGNTPRDLVAGDFDGNGSLDLAVVNQGGNSVSILKNSLAAAPAATPTGGTPGSDVAALDVNANSYAAGAGDDWVSAGDGGDTLQGNMGADILYGDDGDDRVYGGKDNDLVDGGLGDDMLFGDLGSDTVSGGNGADTMEGGEGDDRLDGGYGADVMQGGAGNDLVVGGEGADTVRGGQGNDVILGGTGNDWLSGDKGDDTVTGGAGADIFHSFGEAGVDRVTDFNLAEGDRIQLDPGTTYTMAQVGGDTVLTLGGGGQVVLVGVQAATLTGDWIFGA